VNGAEVSARSWKAAPAAAARAPTMAVATAHSINGPPFPAPIGHRTMRVHPGRAVSDKALVLRHRSGHTCAGAVTRRVPEESGTPGGEGYLRLLQRRDKGSIKGALPGPTRGPGDYSGRPSPGPELRVSKPWP